MTNRIKETMKGYIIMRPVIVVLTILALLMPASVFAASCGEVSEAVADLSNGDGLVKTPEGDEFRAEALLYYEQHKGAFEDQLHEDFGDIRYLTAGLVVATGQEITGVTDYTSAAINVARVLRALDDNLRGQLFLAMTAYDNMDNQPVYAGKGHGGSWGDAGAYLRWGLNAVTEKNTFIDSNGVEVTAHLEPEVASLIAHLWFGSEELVADLLQNNRNITRRVNSISGYLKGSCGDITPAVKPTKKQPLRIQINN